MTDTTQGAQAPKASLPRDAVSNFYRAVWRWHFYAGLLVLPFMITLAVTGAIYLFKDEVDNLIHADFMLVTPQEERLAPSDIIAAALAAQPGVTLQYTDPRSDIQSTEVSIMPDSGTRMTAYVNQYTGEVLEVRPHRSTFAWTVRYLHSFRFFGATPRMWIEIVAGFTILLVLTGLYLWWPRGQKGGVVTVRGDRTRRVFWRDIHAVTGVFTGAFLIFLVITGMPWSSVWGAQVNQWANGSNFGYPSGVRIDVPMSGQNLDDVAKTSWSLEQAQIPESVPAATSIGVDAAVAEFQALGLHRGFSVGLPRTDTGVFSGSVYPDDLRQQRVVHLDQYTGEPLVDMRYADYGPLGRWLEFGINTHMGQTFGLANQIFLLLVCAGIVLMAVSAAIMWWKRRPAGGMGVPPLPSDRRVFIGLFAILAVGGALFPLTGLALLVMIVLDLIWQAVSRRSA